MPFQLSPGVNVTEIDLTTIVPAVATSTGAIAGVFTWGPANERVLIDSETTLVNTFGKPNSNNAETFFTAANFLGYTNSLYVVRSMDPNCAWNAYANNGSITGDVSILNSNDFQYKFNSGSFDINLLFTARYPGQIGNSLRISVCDSPNAYHSNVVLGSAYMHIGVGSYSSNVTNTSAGALFSVGDQVLVGNSTIGTQYVTVKSKVVVGSNTVLTFDDPFKLASAWDAYDVTIPRYWEFHNAVGNAPESTEFNTNFGNTAAVDALHIVVVDEGGKFTGTPGAVLETYNGLSRARNAKTTGGAVNYYKEVINTGSSYIWAINDLSGASSVDDAINVVTSTNNIASNLQLMDGWDSYDETNIPLSVLAMGYEMFVSSEDVDISLILQGKPTGGSGLSSGYTVNNFQLANWIIDNICEVRKDCVLFVTPDDAMITGHKGNESTALVAWRNILRDTSYAVMDSGYKYQYDRYNDVYRWLPTNGDIAGLCARTDSLRDPWWSPAGYNRGQLKNLVKMRYNPRKAERDNLYKNAINPVVSFPGKGTILYGDKTLTSKPSAFDRINVRRLFIVLEKAIATSAKYSMFEFNDEFTRSQFRNLINPYLRDVKARRGITDFIVVCDNTNNTPERVDRNEFWGDIYIKPARSINFIQLNFVAVASGVAFSEVVGKF
jgi:hypothetical protein